MKKIISFIVLIFTFSCVVCYATETPTISLLEKKGVSGEICIDIQISENSTACGGKMDISYDNSLLQPVRYEVADDFSNGMFLVNLNYDVNHIRLSWAGTDEITAGGTMCTVTFSIVDQKNFSTIVDISQCKMADVNSQPITVKTQKCEISYVKKTSSSSSSRSHGTSDVKSNANEREEIVNNDKTILNFVDVKPTDWFYDSIKYVVENKLMDGISEDGFAPDGTLTRAMLITVIYRNEGELSVLADDATTVSPFADIDMNAYYADAVLWGKQNGIINGVTENEFAPDSNITREQIATIIHRYAQYKGYDVSVGENTNILSYNDAGSISEYAISSMQYVVGSGLIKGKSDTTLNPLDKATRAELATILQRFIKTNKKG